MSSGLKEFLEGSQNVPSSLYSQTLKLSSLTLNPKKMLTKFYITNFFGAILTLIICPQFGIGPLGGEIGFINTIMHSGPVWCGIFCATIFFLTGNVISFLFLDKAERTWISRHKMNVVTPYVSFLFMLGMGARSLSLGHIHHDVASFYVSWVVAGTLFSILFYKLTQFKFFNFKSI